jgi:hypothetical protein
MKGLNLEIGTHDFDSYSPVRKDQVDSPNCLGYASLSWAQKEVDLEIFDEDCK